MTGFHPPGAPDAPAMEPELRFLNLNPQDPKFRFNQLQLVTPFAYSPSAEWVAAKPGRQAIYHIPAHPNPAAAATDLASIPWPLWGILAPYGRQLRPALLHDRLCDEINYEQQLFGGDDKVLERRRRVADDLFREALKNPGLNPGGPDPRLPRYRATLFWTGVTVGRLLKFDKILAAIALIHMLIGSASLVLLCLSWCIHLPWPAWITAVAVVSMVLLSFCWSGKVGSAVFVGKMSAWLVVPPLITTWLSAVLIAGVDGVGNVGSSNPPKP